MKEKAKSIFKKAKTINEKFSSRKKIALSSKHQDEKGRYREFPEGVTIEVENPENRIPGLIHAFGSFSDEFKDHEDLLELLNIAMVKLPKVTFEQVFTKGIHHGLRMITDEIEVQNEMGDKMVVDNVEAKLFVVNLIETKPLDSTLDFVTETLGNGLDVLRLDYTTLFKTRIEAVIEYKIAIRFGSNMEFYKEKHVQSKKIQAQVLHDKFLLEPLDYFVDLDKNVPDDLVITRDVNEFDFEQAIETDLKPNSVLKYPEAMYDSSRRSPKSPFDMIFDAFENMAKNMEEEEDKGVQKCPLCFQKFRDKAEFTLHFFNHGIQMKKKMEDLQ